MFNGFFKAKKHVAERADELEHLLNETARSAREVSETLKGTRERKLLEQALIPTRARP